MYAIYGNIYHQYTPFMLAYIPYMDPMGYCTQFRPMKIVGKSPLEADLRSMAAHGRSSRHLRRFRKKKKTEACSGKKEHGQNMSKHDLFWDFC